MSKSVPSYVEDLDDTPIDIEAVLSDEALVEGGLVPIKAYARTRSSKAALRAKRHRERAEAGEGDRPPKKQLNVMAPPDDDAREAVKQVAEALVEGRMKPADIRSFDSEVVRLGKAVQGVLARGGIRAAVLRALVGQYLR